MRGAIKLITFSGLVIYGHWTLFALLGWVMAFNVLAGADWMQWGWAMLLALAMAASIALHEFGHAFVGTQLGIGAQSLVLFPVGGLASISRFPGSVKEELLISLAGPMVSFLFATGLSVFAPNWEGLWPLAAFTERIDAGNFLYTLYAYNVFLTAVNLLPAFPLDGGRILRALLGCRYNYITATDTVSAISKGTAIVLLIAGMFILEPMLVLIGLFILFFANTEEYYLRIKALVGNLLVKEVVMNDFDSLRADLTVSEAANVLTNNHSRYFVVTEGEKPVGSLDRFEVIKALADMKYDVPLKELMKEDLLFFRGEERVTGILDRLARHPERIYPVLTDERFYGVINFRHIIEYLLLHKAATGDYARIRSLAALI